MKKSKKLGLQSLALVLMSLILVAGVAFGMTGAWFQDTDSKDAGSITMGKPVTIYLNGAEGVEFSELAKSEGDGTVEAAMPGDTYTWKGLSVYVEEDSSAMYLVLKINAAADATFELPEIAEGWTKMTAIGAAEDDGVDYYFKALDASAADTEVAIYEAGNFELATTLENGVAGQSISISGTVHAIQQANVKDLNADSDADTVNKYFAGLVG